MSPIELIRFIIPIILSIIAIGISIFTYVNAETQTSIQKQALNTANSQLINANEQLKLAKLTYESSNAFNATSQNAAEKSFYLSKENFEFQKKQIELEMQLIAVFSSEFLANLEAPINHHKSFDLSFINKTTKPIAYHVQVESEGFAVYHVNANKNTWITAIDLDRNPVALFPGESYIGNFIIGHSTTPATNGKLKIKINNKLLIDYDYIYNLKSKTYHKKI